MRVVVTTQAEFDAAVARGDAVEVRTGRFTACGQAWVTAYGDAVVWATGNARVWAHDHAEVSAHDNAEVYAHDNAKAWAYGNAVVRRPLPIDPAWRKLYEREYAMAKAAA